MFKKKKSAPKTIKFLELSLLFIGLLQLGIGAILYQGTRSFLATAIPSQGEIIALDRRQDDDSTSYYPVIQFETQSGQIIEFTSATGFDFSTYQVEDEVTILYSQESPQEARIDSFSALWMPSLTLLSIGGLFTLIPTGLIISQKRRDKLNKSLQKQGKIIITKYNRTTLNETLKVNGQSPYQIISQWQDPIDQKLYVFKSENIWFDPEEFVGDREIKVYINPDNYKQYYMDINFLPELAN